MPLRFRLVIFLSLAVFFLLAYASAYYRRMRNLIQKKFTLLMTADEYSGYIRLERNKDTEIADDDRRFLERSFQFLNDNIGNQQFMVEDLARHLNMSRTSYYNRMKRLTGLSPVDFIKQMRIKKALKLMGDSQLSITDIAYLVGFSDSKYFSKCFKAEMGVTPSQYRSGLHS